MAQAANSWTAAGEATSSATPPVIFAPDVLECRLAVCREKIARFSQVSIVAMRMTDADIPLMYEFLNHSECDITELDLSFNRLTDDGLRILCETLAAEGLMAHHLNSLRVGGNDISEQALSDARKLFTTQRPDVTISVEPLMKEAQALMLVGKVFDESPAKLAGLRKGDVILAFGPMTYNGRRRNAGFKTEQERQMDILQHFESIEASLKPLVAGAVGSDGANKKEIDVIVAREGSGHLRLTLRPARWSGAGLIGAKITAIEVPDPKMKEPVGSKMEAAKA